jgi:hypothetical protein
MSTRKGPGRPSDYTEDIAAAICARLVEGESLKAICREDGMPAASTVFVWLESHEEFRTKYARARELQAELQVDEMTEIADNGQNDWMERKNAAGEIIGWKENGEALTRSKMRLEQRRWNAEKLLPKKYGAKVAIGGADDLPPVKTESTITAEEAYKRMLNGG